MHTNHSRLPLALLAALLVGAFLSPSCGGGGSPSSSTPPTTVAPQPTPTPPTGGGGGVGASSCPLGPGDLNAECEKTSSRLVNAVFDAMDRLVQQKPQIFDKTDESGTGTGQYRVLDHEAYLNGSGHVRRNGTYFETCTPANFPVDRGGLPPAGSGCGYPYPQPISRMNCKLHLYGPDFYTLDSTALVGPDSGYCAQIGYTDGRALCPVRIEGSPERVPCETWRVGYAKDNGRAGPTWTNAITGKYCTGPASGCENHPTNQYALLVYSTGTYQVCANSGSCCSVEVQR
jgi:hypothetical protein